ncbi:MAG: hypothetical protein LUH04_17110 [Clostridium sp.]|nr:hypothetical protein [Clostridium sp.]
MLRKRLCPAVLAAALCLALPNAALGAGPGTAGSWRQDNGQWYYYDTSGNMLTGWILVNGQYYYLYEDGHCAMNEITPDGYRVDESGAWYKVERDILGQKFSVPVRFASPDVLGTSWGENAEAMANLGKAVSAAFGATRKLSISEDMIEYLSAQGDVRYIGLYKDYQNNGYRLDLRIRLDRSGAGDNRYAEYNYGVFKAMTAAVSSTPDVLEEAIYSAWQGQNTYGINRVTPVQAGDCTVTYEAGDGYGKFFIRP